jgi:hypothetical protein
MRRKQLIVLAFTLFVGVISFGCKKGSTPPISERIAKAWLAQSVKEGNVVVYTRGATSFTRDYSAFVMTLNASGAVTYKDFDGVTFSGQWEIANNTLRLKNLTPIPTDTNGIIEFDINSLGDNQLVITRKTGNRKTGNSVNQYTLQLP